MSRIYDFIFCKTSENLQGKACTAYQIFGTQGFFDFPAVLSFDVLVTIYDMKARQDVPIKVTLEDPQGKIISNVKGVVRFEPRYPVSQRFAGIDMTVGFNEISIPESGIYKVKIYENEKILGEKEFLVYHAEKDINNGKKEDAE